MTDLQGKFTALEQTLSGKLDTIISLLSGQSNTGSDNSIALNAIIDRLDTAQAQRGSEVTIAGDIRAAIGDISSYPANYTVRRLLAMLIAAIDVEPLPMQRENPTPDGDCAPYTRVESWNDAGIFTHDGAPYHVWIPVFPYHVGQQDIVSVPEPNGLRRALFPSIPTSTFLCINWDWTASVSPIFILIVRNTNSEPFSETLEFQLTALIEYATAPDYKDGAEEIIKRTSEPGVSPVEGMSAQMYVLFSASQSVAPPLNMWIGSRGMMS